MSTPSPRGRSCSSAEVRSGVRLGRRIESRAWISKLKGKVAGRHRREPGNRPLHRAGAGGRGGSACDLRARPRSTRIGGRVAAGRRRRGCPHGGLRYRRGGWSGAARRGGGRPLRRAGRPREQCRREPARQVRGDERRGLAGHPPAQRPVRLPGQPAGDPPHARGRRRVDRLRVIGLRSREGRPGTVDLQYDEDGADLGCGHHGPRTRRRRNPRELRRARLHPSSPAEAGTSA